MQTTQKGESIWPIGSAKVKLANLEMIEEVIKDTMDRYDNRV